MKVMGVGSIPCGKKCVSCSNNTIKCGISLTQLQYQNLYLRTINVRFMGLILNRGRWNFTFQFFSLYQLGKDNNIKYIIISGQAMDIGAPAVLFLIDAWEGHLTPPEAAGIADKVNKMSP